MDQTAYTIELALLSTIIVPVWDSQSVQYLFRPEKQWLRQLVQQSVQGALELGEIMQDGSYAMNKQKAVTVFR